MGNDGPVRALNRRPSLTERLQSVPQALQRKKSIKIEDFSLTNWEVSGVQRCLADDFTHVCMEMHWTSLLGFVFGTYAAVSLAFACVFYCVDGTNGLGGDIPTAMSAFEVCMWFATVNIVTAGFGSMVPLSTTAYVISTLAHMTGLLLNALLLGIVVAKASLPSAKMVFSNTVCVRNRNSVQQLMVRVGNARGNVLFSPDIRWAYVHAVRTLEGETYFEDSLLQTHCPAALKPAFTITHAVTQDSPLYGKTEADIVQEKGFFLLIVSATDVETGQSIYARRLFFMKDFRFNHAFEDVITESKAGQAQLQKLQPSNAALLEVLVRQTKLIDFWRFHDTAPLHADCWSEIADNGKPVHRFGNVTGAGKIEEEKPGLPAIDDVVPRSLKPIGRLESFNSDFNDSVGNWSSVAANGNKRNSKAHERFKAERSYSASELSEFDDAVNEVARENSFRRRLGRPSSDKEPSFDCWRPRK